MSSSFIGYILVGPEKLSEQKIKKAWKRARMVADFCERLRGAYLAIEAGEPHANGLLDTLAAEAERRGLQLDWDDFYGDPNAYALKAHIKLRDEHGPLADFLHAWTHGAYDAASRDIRGIRKGWQAMACGEMTSGDTPTGDTYSAVDICLRAGILDILGIS